jgi:TP901 family phage tail tape measure protein
MAGRDDALKIVIQGSLDLESTTEKINSQLRKIATSIDRLNLGVNFDTSAMRELSSKIKQIQNKLNLNKELKIFNADETRRWYTSVQEAVKEYSKLGTVNVSQNIDPATKKIRDFILEIKKANGEIEKIRFKPVNISDGTIAFQEEAKKVIDKTKELREKQLQQQQKINAQIEKENQRHREKEANEYIKWWNKTLSAQEKAAKELNSRMQAALNLEVKFNALSPKNKEELIKQLEQYKKSIQELQSKNALGNLVTGSDLQNLKNAENAIRRLYEQTKIISRDSQGFDYTKYEKMVNPIKNATNAQEYYNKSLIEGKKLLDANVAVTNEYIKVSQRLREGSQITNITAYINRATGETYKFSEAQKDLLTRTYSLNSALKTAAEKMALWSAAGGMFFGVQNAIQNVIDTTIELDNQMTQLKRVMDSDTNFDALLQGAISLSKELGRNLTETNASLIEFARAGQQSAEALENARAVLVAMNVSELTAEEATKTVIVGRKVYNDELKNSIDLIDRLNQVDNDFSTTTKDLSQSLIKAASTAKAFGVDLNTLIGYTVAIQASTQETGNVVGNSLKTILSRITTVNESISQLNDIGISIRKSNGDVKSASEVISELASKWKTLTDEQRQNMAIAAAGRYQLNRFLALMDGMDVALKASATAASSQGSALRENEKAMQSLTSKLNQLQGAWQAFISLISDGGLNTGLSLIITSTTKLIEGFTEFTKLTNGLNITLPALVLTLYGISKAFVAISTAAKTAELSVKGFKVSLGLIGIALVGIETLVSAFISTSDSIIQTTEDYQKFSEKSRETAENLESLINRYEELKQQSFMTKESQEELRQVMAKIQQIQPGLVKSTDEYGNALEINTEKAKAFADTLRNMSIEQANLAKATLQAQNAKLDLDIDDASKNLKKIEKKYQDISDQILSFQKKYKVNAIEDAREIAEARQKELDQLQKAGNIDLYHQRRVELLDYIKELRRYEENLDKISDTEYLEAQQALQALEDKKKANNEQISILNKLISGNKDVKDSQDELNQSYVAGIAEIDDYTDSSSDFISTQEELFKSFESTKKEVSSLNQILADLAAGKSISADQAAELIIKEKELANAFTIENGMVKVNQQAIIELRNAKLKSFEDMAAARAQDLSKQKETLIQKLNNYGIEIQAIQSVADAQKAIAGIDSRMYKARSIAEAMELEKTKRQVEGVKAQFEQIETLKKLISSPTFGQKESKSRSSSSKSEYTPLTKEAKELLRIETELEKVRTNRDQLLPSSKEYRDSLQKEKNLIQQKINLLNKEYEQVAKSQKAKSNVKNSDDAFKRANELEQQIVRLQADLNKLSFEQINSQIQEFAEKNQYLDDRLKLVQERLSSYPETSQKYRDTLEEEILHLKEKQELYHQEAEMIRDQLSKGKLTIAQREELNKKILELQASWLNLQNTIDDKKLQKINSLLSEQKEKTDELSKVIELSKAKMDAISDKTSQQYLDEYQSYLQLIQLKEQSLQKEIQLREQLIQQNIQNIELVKKLKNEIVDLQIEQLRLKQVFEESTAGNIVDLYKSVYEEQKKIALQALDDEIEAENKRHDEKIKHLEDELKKKEKTTQKEIEAIEKQIEAEEERHDKVIKGLDDELERYREVINMRLKSIDREVSEKEYNDEMEQLQKERQRIQEQINVLMLDDSYEAKLRISELNEQLAEKDKQIEDLAYKRGVELRKDNLQDALEKYEKEVDEKKKAENEKFNETKKQLENEKKKLDEQLKYYKEYIDKQIEKEKEKHEKIIDNLNKEKEATQRHYEQLLADEKRFADLRRAILSGNLNAIQGDLNTFASFIQSNMSKIGQSIANNLLAKIEEAKRAISQLNNVSLPSYGGGSSGNSGGSNSNIKSEWLQYKKQVNEIVYAKGKWTEAHKQNNREQEIYWENRAKPYYAQLPADLAALLKKMDYEEAYDFYKGNFHVGGIVGGKSDRLTEIVNKMFNLKPNEGIAKVLEGELFTTPRNIAQNFIPNLQRLISNITPVVQVNGGTVAGGTGDIVFNLNIERFTGTQADYDKLANYVMDKIMLANKKRGR